MNIRNLQDFVLNAVFALIVTLSLVSLPRPGWSDYQQMRDEVDQFHAFMV